MTKVLKKPQAVVELESTLVAHVRLRGAVSRVELSRELKLVPSTAGIYVDRLIQSGHLLESSPKVGRGLGRPPVLLELNPRVGRFVGVDFDARQLMAVAVNFAQQPLERVRRTIPARASAVRVLQMIEESIAHVAGPRRRELLGIGLGVPGPIDADRGISRDYHFIRGWHDVPIGPRMAAHFGVPVFVENNLRSMALGELWCGQGRGLRNLVCLGIRSGIGSGIIVHGNLLRGANNLAGEIGRWSWPSAEPATIEDVASLTAILMKAAQRLSQGEPSELGKPGSTPSVAGLLSAVAAGDRLALELCDEAADVHGWIVHQLSQLFDPQRIVVAGALVESDRYLRVLQQAAARLGGAQSAARIVRSTLGDFAGAIGAAALAFHHWKPRR